MVTRMVLSAEDSPSFLMFCYCGAVDDWNSAGHVIRRNLCASVLPACLIQIRLLIDKPFAFAIIPAIVAYFWRNMASRPGPSPDGPYL